MARPREARPFPLGPLELLVQTSRREIQVRTKLNGVLWGAVLTEGFTVFQADRAANAFGLHPAWVWDNWFSAEDVILEEAS